MDSLASEGRWLNYLRNATSRETPQRSAARAVACAALSRKSGSWLRFTVMRCLFEHRGRSPSALETSNVCIKIQTFDVFLGNVGNNVIRESDEESDTHRRVRYPPKSPIPTEESDINRRVRYPPKSPIPCRYSLPLRGIPTEESDTMPLFVASSSIEGDPHRRETHQTSV